MLSCALRDATRTRHATTSATTGTERSGRLMFLSMRQSIRSFGWKHSSGRRLEAESRPKAEREVTASANLVSDFGKQFADNPRLARLMQLASQKNCKVQ